MKKEIKVSEDESVTVVRPRSIPAGLEWNTVLCVWPECLGRVEHQLEYPAEKQHECLET